MFVTLCKCTNKWNNISIDEIRFSSDEVLLIKMISINYQNADQLDTEQK